LAAKGAGQGFQEIQGKLVPNNDTFSRARSPCSLLGSADFWTSFLLDYDLKGSHFRFMLQDLKKMTVTSF
jgi:hypothetical protein